MRWQPMRRALFRISRSAYHRWGRFAVIDELGILREEQELRGRYTPEDADFLARFCFLIWAANYLGRGDAPWEETIRENVSKIKQVPRDPEKEKAWSWRFCRADGNARAVRKLLPVLEEDVLAPRWRRRKKGVWSGETPLGNVNFESGVELIHDTHPDLRFWVENGPRGAVYPDRLFSLAEPDSFLIFDDLEDFERRYRAFLTLLNVFIDELREMGERYMATGQFD